MWLGLLFQFTSTHYYAHAHRQQQLKQIARQQCHVKDKECYNLG